MAFSLLQYLIDLYTDVLLGYFETVFLQLDVHPDTTQKKSLAGPFFVCCDFWMGIDVAPFCVSFPMPVPQVKIKVKSTMLHKSA